MKHITVQGLLLSFTVPILHLARSPRHRGRQVIPQQLLDGRLLVDFGPVFAPRL
jgi:hypothetical protein